MTRRLGSTRRLLALSKSSRSSPREPSSFSLCPKMASLGCFSIMVVGRGLVGRLCQKMVTNGLVWIFRLQCLMLRWRGRLKVIFYLATWVRVQDLWLLICNVKKEGFWNGRCKK